MTSGDHVSAALFSPILDADLEKGGCGVCVLSVFSPHCLQYGVHTCSLELPLRCPKTKMGKPDLLLSSSCSVSYGSGLVRGRSCTKW